MRVEWLLYRQRTAKPYVVLGATVTWLRPCEVVATGLIVCEAVELGLHLSILLPATPALWDPKLYQSRPQPIFFGGGEGGVGQFTRLFPGNSAARLAPVQP